MLRTSLLVAFITSFAWFAVPVEAVANDDAVEEIVVTGTYIKRKDSFNTPNPIHIVDSSDIAEQGVATMGDIIKNQTFNYGTITTRNTISRAPQQGYISSANLRGLGSGATLLLVNGHRTAHDNVNMLLPQIAIQRIETVKDGASALYGSDAVAGVVNFITDNDFEGFSAELWSMFPRDDAGAYKEHQIQLKFGAGNDRTHAVAAFEYNERNRLALPDRRRYSRVQYGSSGTGQPGTWLVPTRSIDPASGEVVIDGVQRAADPGCGIDDGPGGTDLSSYQNHVSGRLTSDADGSRCQFEFGEFQDYLAEYDRYTLWAFASHDASDWLKFEVEISFAEDDNATRGSPSQPGGRFDEIGPIPGDHPGNPWRAFVDRNRNGVIDAGEHLFAEHAVDLSGALVFDQFGRPVAARDINGDGMPDRGAHGDPAGVVVLAADPFDPSTGIPFNEDVDAVSVRLQGKQGPIPASYHGSGASVGGPLHRDTRLRGGMRIDVPDTSWSGDLFYLYHVDDVKFGLSGFVLYSNVLDGIYGRLGQSGTQFYNPFSTRTHPCVDRVCNPNLEVRPGEPGHVSQEVIDQLFSSSSFDEEHKLEVFDAVFAGNVIELPAGPLGLAIGGQWRREAISSNYPAEWNACGGWVLACGTDSSLDRSTYAAFAEAAVPVLNDDVWGLIDLQLAVRYEDADGPFDSTDPKIAVRWQPREWIALRASWGTSFIAPELDQLFPESISFLRPVQDRTCELSADCAAGVFVLPSATLSSNPDLAPEEAEVINAGITLRLLDDSLSISFDWTDFEFTDRITQISPPLVLDQDFVAYQAFIGAGGTRAQWIDPDCPGKGAGGACETGAIRRNAVGEIDEVFTRYVNAQEMNWRGIDFSIDYRFDANAVPGFGPWGMFMVGITGTWVDSYTYRLTDSPSETCPADIGGVPPCQATGNRNDAVPVIPPIPEWRVNGRLAWIMGNHNASLLARFNDKVREDSGDPRNPEFIDSEVTFDASYTYSFAFGKRFEASVMIGGINIFDTYTDPIYTAGGLETFLYDPRGALWYGRVNVSL